MKRDRADAGSHVRAELMESLARFARSHPDLTLGEVVLQAGVSLSWLESMRARDLWPDPIVAPTNGTPISTKSSLSPQMQLRVQQIRDLLPGLGNEFVCNDIMAALDVSRQTALRALGNVPEVRMVGKLKHAKYVVIRS